MDNRSLFLKALAGGALGTILVLVLVSMMLHRNPQLLMRYLTGQFTLPSSQNTSGPPTQRGQLTEESAVIDVVKKTNPAVVSIVITQDVPVIERYYQQIPGSPFGNFFSPFQFQMPQLRQNGTQKQEVGGGSGFIVSADGLIITNRHVVSQQNAEYTVFRNDGTKYTAKIIARDPLNDIAVLKIDVKNLPFLEFGSSDNLQIGQSVVAIGNALGEFRNTVSVGVISGLSRSITAGDVGGAPEQLDNVIQTDAAINPGNSGGPLLNLDGKVVGVNVAIAQGSENVGFALPANVAKSVAESVQKTGRIVRPYLGVRYTVVTPELKGRNNLPVDYGAFVTRGDQPTDVAVLPNSPAAKAGIQEDDIILEVDDKKIDDHTSLSAYIAQKNVGDHIRLKVWSKGVTKDVNVTLQEIPQ